MLKFKYFFVLCIAISLGITANAQQSIGKAPTKQGKQTKTVVIPAVVDTDLTRVNEVAYAGNVSSWEYGSVDLATGTMTPTGAIGSTPFPSEEEYAANGKVYRVTLDNNLLEVNPDDGSATDLGSITGLPVDYVVTSMAYNWDNNMMFIAALENSNPFPGKLYTLDLNTLNTTLVGNLTGANGLIAMDFAEDGFLYGPSIITDKLHKIDPNTATTTEVGDLGINIDFGQDVSYDFDSHQLYTITCSGGFFWSESKFGTYDLTTGAFTEIQDMGGDQYAVFVITNTPSMPVYAIDIDNYDFGVIDLAATATQDFTISNTGDADLVINSMTLSGTNAAEFTHNAAMPLTIAPGNSHTFTVTFDPAGLGWRYAQIDIASNDGNHTVTLKGAATSNIPTIPVSNWAIILGIALIIGGGLFRFFR